jgi:hypothetical protein
MRHLKKEYGQQYRTDRREAANRTLQDVHDLTRHANLRLAMDVAAFATHIADYPMLLQQHSRGMT